MSKENKLDPAEVELFRKAVGKVTPIRNQTAQPGRKRPRKIGVPANRTDDPAPVSMSVPGDTSTLSVDTGDVLGFRRSGIQNLLFRKLKRGQIKIEDELDLHGMTTTRARSALVRFLSSAQAANLRCVRIIHGKGYGSKDRKPVIKLEIQRWLQENLLVLAYCSCQPADGGTGAIYVLLKKTS